MSKQLLAATAAMLIALAGQAMAQEAIPAQNEQAQPAGDTPPDGTGSTTGGVTAPAKEMLPGDTSETPVDGDALDAAGSSETDPATQAGAGSAKVVGADVVRELYEMALEQQHKAATPAKAKSEEAKQAEQKAIASHRDALFARMEEMRG